MNQFKDLFLGAERRNYSRATSSQKCVRAGGKHNDLENVGFTRPPPHLLRNAGQLQLRRLFQARSHPVRLELVTDEKWFGIPKDRLYVTIFEGADVVPRDDEAEHYWIEAGVPRERIFQYGLKDNFWQMAKPAPAAPAPKFS